VIAPPKNELSAMIRQLLYHAGACAESFNQHAELYKNWRDVAKHSFLERNEYARQIVALRCYNHSPRERIGQEDEVPEAARPDRHFQGRIRN